MTSAARTATVPYAPIPGISVAAAAARGGNLVPVGPDKPGIAAVTALSAAARSARAAGANLYGYRAGISQLKRGMIDKPARAAAAAGVAVTLAPAASAAAGHDQNLYGGRTFIPAVKRERVRLLAAQRGSIRREGMDFADHIIYDL
jgi:hypothetical protein